MQAVSITMEYVVHERGPMTTLGGVEGLAFINTRYANRSGLYPDIQFHMAPASINSDAGARVRKILGITDKIFDTVYRPLSTVDTWTIIPLLLRPKSRGWVRLRSKNPFHYPLINANYFDHPEDIARLVEGVKIALRVSILHYCNSRIGSKVSCTIRLHRVILILFLVAFLGYVHVVCWFR